MCLKINNNKYLNTGIYFGYNGLLHITDCDPPHMKKNKTLFYAPCLGFPFYAYLLGLSTHRINF